MHLGTIKFKKKTLNQILLWIMLITPYTIIPLVNFSILPSVFKYIPDICWLFLLLCMLTRTTKKEFDVKFLSLFIGVFFVTAFFLYFMNYQSLFYFLWGLRNNVRFYVFFLSVILSFREEDMQGYYVFLDVFFAVEVLAMLVQRFILNYKGDSLGGVFGNESGCNGYVNLFFCIYLAISYMEYTNNRINLQLFIIRIGLMLILAGFAEIKFFYVEFVIILVVYLLITEFSVKKMIIIVAAVLALDIGYQAMLHLFPNSILNVSVLLEYGSSVRGYTGTDDLNRLYFMGKINSLFLVNPFWILFGLGMGNCDYAGGYGFITSPFYEANQNLHYTWFSTTHMYLENGLLGLCFLFGFFVLIVFFCYKRIKREKNEDICRLAIVCAVIGIMNLVYNNSLRTEAGYMLYLVCAFPFLRNMKSKGWRL